MHFTKSSQNDLFLYGPDFYDTKYSFANYIPFSNTKLAQNVMENSGPEFVFIFNYM